MLQGQVILNIFELLSHQVFAYAVSSVLNTVFLLSLLSLANSYSTLRSQKSLINLHTTTLPPKGLGNRVFFLSVLP